MDGRHNKEKQDDGRQDEGRKDEGRKDEERQDEGIMGQNDGDLSRCTRRSASRD